MRTFSTKILILNLFICVASFPALSHANKNGYIKYTKEYSIEEAYAFFDKKRTPFKTDVSRLSKEEKRYLDHLFFVTDLALKARVNMMQYYFSGTHKKHIGTYNEKINEILGTFTMIESPSEDVKEVEEFIVGAIRDQQEFLNEWANSNGAAFHKIKGNHKDHLLVQSSHMKIQRAYTNLMLIYPDEHEYNHQAFYDHLSALDFIN